MTFQPRWLAFAADTGIEPADTSPRQLAAFMGWINRRLDEWRFEAGVRFVYHLTDEQQAEFTAWLTERFQ